MTTNNDLAQAREWAEWIIQADNQVEVDPDLRGVANVIQSLPDEWFDADPAQIHAAVAEVIRLRRAITDLRDDYLAHISTRESFVDQVSGLVVEIREDVDDYYGTAARDLTRILEGKA